MFGKTAIQSLAVVALSVCTAHAVEIETVPVGNPGNTADDTGYGAVDYEYQIGKYEITNSQWREFLNIKAAVEDPYGLYNTEMAGTYGGIARSGDGTEENPWVYCAKDHNSSWDNRPVNYVSFWDVARFCNWLHNGQGDGDTGVGAYVNIGDSVSFARSPEAKWFIPTENEWYKAAYHKNDGVTGNYFDYPTSSDAVPSNDLITPDPGNNANFYVSGDSTIGSPYYTTEVGEFENSESPYGTFDQGGNLCEWNETLVSGSLRSLRGGVWYYGSVSLEASTRSYVDPTYESDGISGFGFRVASIPEPVIPIEGDLNGDGFVGSADLDLVRSFWLETVELGNGLMGDANGDGLVNSADLDIVRSNWGAGLAAVPEPGVVLLVVAGAVLGAFRRRW